MLRKILLAIKQRELMAILYERYFIFGLSRMKGFFSIWFYRMIFSSFECGKNIKCWGTISVGMSRGSSITVGDQVWIVSDFKRAAMGLFMKCKLRTLANGRIVIGDRVALNASALTSRKEITIEEGTMLAPNVTIVDSDFHKLWPPKERFSGMGYESDRPVHIGKHVWVGMNTTILKGVTIGDNSIIGAGSVVTHSIPSNVIAAGNPAKVIRSLSEKDAVE